MMRLRSPAFPALLPIPGQEVEPVAAGPAHARRVVLQSTDQVVEIVCQVRITTKIVLPYHERILDFVSGDAGPNCTWRLSGAANIA